MQQFTVPQFVDVEDKVVGPLSVRQFIILLVGGGFCALYYKLFDFTLFLFSGIITILIAACFAFVKVSGMPFHYFLLNLIVTLSRPTLRIWNKTSNLEAFDTQIELPQKGPKVTGEERHYTMSHLNRLSLIVDTKGYYAGQEEAGEVYREKDDELDMHIG